uniref:Uncharacterized protein n=1 Tax=Macrostomum lignano TaxID=282301 RepID=A0A1I8I6C9_9PLAT
MAHQPCPSQSHGSSTAPDRCSEIVRTFLVNRLTDFTERRASVQLILLRVIEVAKTKETNFYKSKNKSNSRVEEQVEVLSSAEENQTTTSDAVKSGNCTGCPSSSSPARPIVYAPSAVLQAAHSSTINLNGRNFLDPYRQPVLPQPPLVPACPTNWYIANIETKLCTLMRIMSCVHSQTVAMLGNSSDNKQASAWRPIFMSMKVDFLLQVSTLILGNTRRLRPCFITEPD